MNDSSKKAISPQRFTGTVVSDKMNKTVVVEIKRQKRDPKYHKIVRLSSRIQAHDESGAKVGDKVVIEATRPISRMKKFKVVEKI